MRNTLSSAIKCFAVGAALFALPTVMMAAYNTLSFGCATGGCGPGETGFNITAPFGGGLDAVMLNFMADLWNPVMVLIPAFSYIAGIVLIIIGISRLLKTSQEGPRGPAGAGTIVTFLAGGALLSVDAMMGAFSGSLFTQTGGTIQTYATLAFDTSAMTANDVAHIENTLTVILAFVMIIGWISFVRGFLILRDVAEGNGQATIMSGMSHLFGGALAVNLGPAMNAIQSSVGVGDIGLGFL